MGIENFNRKFIVNEEGEAKVEEIKPEKPHPKITIGKGENKKELIWDKEQEKYI